MPALDRNPLAGRLGRRLMMSTWSRVPNLVVRFVVISNVCRLSDVGARWLSRARGIGWRNLSLQCSYLSMHRASGQLARLLSFMPRNYFYTLPDASCFGSHVLGASSKRFTCARI
jgi:hypothetical protein